MLFHRRELEMEFPLWKRLAIRMIRNVDLLIRYDDSAISPEELKEFKAIRKAALSMPKKIKALAKKYDVERRA